MISRSIFLQREDNDVLPNPPGMMVASHPIKDIVAVINLDNWHSSKDVANFTWLCGG
jgi:hypothetical protein